MDILSAINSHLANKNIILINRSNHISASNSFHKKRYKVKYDCFMNKNNIGDMKLTYRVKYNWLLELLRVIKFDKWNLFMDNKYKYVVYVAFASLTDIPKEIGEFVNLHVLCIHYNNIKKIPSEIGNIKTLASLYLYANPLKYIPKNISKRTNLNIFFMERST